MGWIGARTEPHTKNLVLTRPRLSPRWNLAHHTGKLSISLLVSEARLTWSIAETQYGAGCLINMNEAEVSVEALGVEQLRLGTIFLWVTNNLFAGLVGHKSYLPACCLSACAAGKGEENSRAFCLEQEHRRHDGLLIQQGTES